MTELTKSTPTEIGRCSVIAEKGKYKFRPLEKRVFSVLEYVLPKGRYTNNYKALYSDSGYEIGMRIDGYVWENRGDEFKVSVQNGEVITTPRFDYEDGFLYFSIRTPPTLKFKMENYLPDSMWSNMLVTVSINDVIVKSKDTPMLLIPFCNKFQRLENGRDFVNNKHMFLPLHADQDVILEMISGGGGGGPSSLVEGETISAERGGHMCLFILEPETDEIIPLIAIEGGLAGEAVEGAHGSASKGEAKIVDLVGEGGIVMDYQTHSYHFYCYTDPSNYPVDSITDVSGVPGYPFADDVFAGASGDGVIVKDVGYRGTAGSSGQRARLVVKADLLANMNVGPLLIINPLANFAAKGYLNKYGFDLSQQACVGGEGGYSPAGSGEEGQAGGLLIIKGSSNG